MSLRCFWLVSVILLLFLPLGCTAGRGLVRTEAVRSIRFTGNAAFSDRQLLDAARLELDDLAGAAFKQSVIDDVAFLMELMYRQAGYPGAAVDYRYTGPPAEEILFIVNEGQQIMVTKLTFRGNRRLASDRLLAGHQEIRASVLKNRPFPFVKDDLFGLAADIGRLYHAEGFLDAEVLGPHLIFTEDGRSVTAAIDIEEGARYHIGSVVLTGDIVAEARAELAAAVADLEGLTYYSRRKLMLRSGIIDIYENLGYAHVAITVEAAKKPATATVDLRAQISSGSPVVTGEIEILGHQRTRRSFIESRLQLQPGKLFTADAKRQSLQNLYQTGLFSRVDVALTGRPADERQNVLVEVAEKPAKELYLEPGWGSYELLRLATGYRDRNLFGTGRIFRFDTNFSVMGRTIESGFTDPWFLDSTVSADVPAHYRYRQEPSFTLENYGVGVNFSRAFPYQIFASLGYQLSFNAISDVEIEEEALTAENYNKASITMQVRRDTRNDPFFPTRGHRSHLSLELAAPQFGGELTFYRLVAGVRFFRPLTESLILGLRYTTGFILPLDDQQGIPLGERFFNGGENTVRSFRESRLGPLDNSGDPVGGTAYNVMTVELRQKITVNLAASFFIDFGNIAPNESQPADQTLLAADRAALTSATWHDYFKDMRSGIGAGIQYLLPVGPLRLDAAFNPEPRATTDENEYVIHFSVGMAF